MLMKKLLKVVAVAAVMAISANSAFAQFGIEAGYAGSQARTKMSESKDVVKSEALNGFYVGANYNVKLIGGLSLQPGINYEYQTAKISELSNLQFSEATANEHYLNVPVRLQYSFEILPVFKVFAYTGPTFSIGLAGGVSCEADIPVFGKVDVKYDYYSGKFSSSNDDIKNVLDKMEPVAAYNRFDIKYGLGLGVELFKFIEVKGGYDWGLMNRYKDVENGDPYMRNDRFYVAVAVRF